MQLLVMSSHTATMQFQQITIHNINTPSETLTMCIMKCCLCYSMPVNQIPVAELPSTSVKAEPTIPVRVPSMYLTNSNHYLKLPVLQHRGSTTQQ